MKVTALVPTPNLRMSFDRYALARIAEGSGCYCLANASHDILYIGQSLSIRRRLVEHFDGPKYGELTPLGRISLVWWLLEKPEGLNALERGWTESVRLADGQLPVFNRTSAPL